MMEEMYTNMETENTDNRGPNKLCCCKKKPSCKKLSGKDCGNLTDRACGKGGKCVKHLDFNPICRSGKSELYREIIKKMYPKMCGTTITSKCCCVKKNSKPPKCKNT